MRNRKLLNILVLIIMNMSTISCSHDVNNSKSNMNCIKSFQDFAYSVELNDPQYNNVLLPQYPWKKVGDIFEYSEKEYFVDSIFAKISRINPGNGKEEIWFIEHLISDNSNPKSKYIFLIYHPHSNEWETIDANIIGTTFHAGNLFVAKDGSLWGRTEWNNALTNQENISIPVLSKYNEITKSFEFPAGMLSISWKNKDEPYFPWPEIVLDNDENFWIFTKSEGLYKYNIISKSVSNVNDMDGLRVVQAVKSIDNEIYLANYSEKIYSKESFFQIINGLLYTYDTKTNQVKPISIPENHWPMFSNIFIDHEGKLWLGAIGWRKNNDWRMIHPDIKEYFDHAGDVYWASPTILIESKDGLLWFNKNLDFDPRVSGIAWYDPNTNSGCMISNYPATIIQDAKNHLWIVIRKTLYKRE